MSAGVGVYMYVSFVFYAQPKDLCACIWLRERVREWLCEWLSEWVSEHMRANGACVNACASMWGVRV